MSSNSHCLVKTLLYFAISASSGNIKKWCRGYVTLTEEALHLQAKDEPYRLVTPLRCVAAVKRLRKNSISPALPANFAICLLKLQNPGDEADSILFAGPKSVIFPFWASLIQRLRKVLMERELAENRRILYLIYLGVRDIENLSFLLSMDKYSLMLRLYRLYRGGFIERSGRLTEKGLRETAQLERRETLPRLSDILNFQDLFVRCGDDIDGFGRPLEL